MKVKILHIGAAEISGEKTGKIQINGTDFHLNMLNPPATTGTAIASTRISYWLALTTAVSKGGDPTQKYILRQTTISGMLVRNKKTLVKIPSVNFDTPIYHWHVNVASIEPDDEFVIILDSTYVPQNAPKTNPVDVVSPPAVIVSSSPPEKIVEEPLTPAANDVRRVKLFAQAGKYKNFSDKVLAFTYGDNPSNAGSLDYLKFHIRPDVDDSMRMNPLRTKIPSIIVDEYQPGKFMMLFSLVKRALERGGVITNQAENQIGQVIDSFGADGQVVSTLLDQVFAPAQMKLVNANIGDVLGRPVTEIRDYFKSDIVAKYVMPFDQDNFISTDGAVGWAFGKKSSSRNSDPTMADEIQEMRDGLSGMLQKYMDVESPPYGQWRMDNPLEGRPEDIQLNFPLYNFDKVSTNDNLRFLYRLFAGPMWLQAGTYKNGGNLYDISVPGRVSLFYAQMSVSIREKGNRRDFTAKLDVEFGELKKMKKNFYVPDIFEVNIVFRSLVPNNFSVHLAKILGVGRNGVQ